MVKDICMMLPTIRFFKNSYEEKEKKMVKNICMKLPTIRLEVLTIMLLVAILANTKYCNKPEEMTEALAYCYSSGNAVSAFQ